MLPNDIYLFNINLDEKTIILYIPVIQLLNEAIFETMIKDEILEWLSDPGRRRLLTIQIVNKYGKYFRGSK